MGRELLPSTGLRVSIVGVVGDVRRDMEGHHHSQGCSVFGLSKEEVAVIHSEGLVTRPKDYNPAIDRFQVSGSPFRVMNLLAKNFGYTVDSCPIEDRGLKRSGERRTCIYTLQAYSK